MSKDTVILIKFAITLSIESDLNYCILEWCYYV